MKNKNNYRLKQTNNLLKVAMACCIMVFSLIASSAVYSQSKTLVIASHPYPEKSVVNKALQQTVQSLDGVSYRNLETLYGNDITAIDVAKERKAYEGFDTVVYMYPIHWFNLTPMLKAYFNEVWFQWAPEALKDKKMLVVITAGADKEAYSHEGKIGLTIEEILAPMKASANYTGMTYLEPLTFLGVSNADESKIRDYQEQLKERLNSLRN